MAALLLASAGCKSASSEGNDDAKVVARILAQSASSPLTFGDQAGAQQLLSSLDASEHFVFGVILDAKKKVFALYSRPDQVSEKEKFFLARVMQSVPTDTSEMLTVDNGVAIAMVRMGKEQTIGYVAVARKAR